MALAFVKVSAKGTNTVTVTHIASSGMTFDLMATGN